ncbi:tripartite tricarboxylate transporter TctB family protein [Desulfosporosinus lacus]|uniref:Tripartite tricarboxylate transporter TctB family protein n=1 Tax=Desulfosporosinus lacus DSM 15449 TaxID=1121420 RepID=A0A1M5ZMP6_9FIRM|nr:tripartite tricarboxylate transporter TctB family protein [Desulfosporosinus lacus]SHI25645.1 Tripartite tricarboxylate transporter TctB family protein [Desulfosporosinus lacus DSM 15449]
MNNLAKQGLASAITLILAIVLYVDSFNLPPAAASLPRALAWIIIVLSMAMFAEAWYKERKKAKVNQETKEPIRIIRVLVFTSMIILYVALIKPLGYFLVTPLFLIVGMAYLKATRLWKAVLIALGFTLFCYFLFVMFLHLPIPMGLFS